MLWDDATTALISHFKTEWESIHSSVPINYPNAEQATPATNGSWGKIRVIHSDSRRIAVGGQLRRETGFIVVNIYTPIGKGDGLAVTLDKDVTAIWDAAHGGGLDGNIHLGAPAPVPNSRDADVPNLWQSGISVPFTVYHAP